MASPMSHVVSDRVLGCHCITNYAPNAPFHYGYESRVQVGLARKGWSARPIFSISGGVGTNLLLRP